MSDDAPTLRSRIHDLLSHPRLLQWLPAVAMVTCLPALWLGWLADDLAHRAVLLKHPPFVGVDPVQHLFRFLEADSVNPTMASVGLLSWWTDLDIEVSFFRPLASLTHVIDYALWPHNAVLQHLHSLLWGGLMVWCAVRFLRAVSPTPLVVGVAALFFAVEDAHVAPIAWLCNRNATIATTFSILAIHAYTRWRTGGGIRAWIGCIAAFALGLCGGETAFAALAWMAAYALTRESSVLRGLRSLIGPVVLVVVWRLAYNALGYGANGSTLYVDPGETPLLWLEAMVLRWPLLMFTQITAAPIDFWVVFDKPLRLATSALGAVVTLVALWMVWPTLRARASARMAALALAGILVPFTAGFPATRLLVLSSLAAGLLLAEVVDHHGLLRPQSDTPSGSRRVRSWMLTGMLVLHIPLSMLQRPVGCWILPQTMKPFSLAHQTLPEDENLSDKALIFLNGTEFTTIYFYVNRTEPALRQIRPQGVALLFPWWTDATVTREDAYTLVVEQEEGFLSRPIDRLFRDPSRVPFVANQRIKHFGMDVHVREITEDGRPAVVAFRFADPLEDQTHRRFAILDLDGAEYWTPPAIGTSVVVPGIL
ncbi:MAG: hypothetical protein CL927_02605 [Deltaproteobacteria bacterium]|nr:hypothetical protein [Deltaproteobacteria bacterium]HCH66920.1 hypothetical protein [Deltaproteobacteria bacterium]